LCRERGSTPHGPKPTVLGLVLQTLDPKARETLRRVLIHDQADRDAIASKLLRYRVERGDDWPNEDR